MLHIIGIGLILLPFISLFILMAKLSTIKEALGIFGVTFLIGGIIALGVFLLSK